MFGEGVATYVLVVDDATITCVSPSGDAGGTVDVTVSNVLGSSVLEDAFSFTGGEPVLLAVDPAEGDEDGGEDEGGGGAHCQGGGARRDRQEAARRKELARVESPRV